MRNEHILIIKLSRLSDIAMLIPVVKSLAEQYPNVRITVLSRPTARVFFENLSKNVSFMEADLKKENKGIGGLNNLCRRLLAKKFSIVADMNNKLRTKYIRLRLNAAGSKVAHVKCRGEKRKIVYTNYIKKRQTETSFQNYIDTLTKLGYPITIKHKPFSK